MLEFGRHGDLVIGCHHTVRPNQVLESVLMVTRNPSVDNLVI